MRARDERPALINMDYKNYFTEDKGGLSNSGSKRDRHSPSPGGARGAGRIQEAQREKSPAPVSTVNKKKWG